MIPVQANVSRRRGRQIIVLGIAILALGTFLAFVLGIDRDGWWLVPLLLGSFFSTFFVWKRFPWDNNLAPYLSFGGALLLACFLNRLLYLSDFLVSGERFSAWPFYAVHPETAFLKAELATILGVFLTFSAWVYPWLDPGIAAIDICL